MIRFKSYISLIFAALLMVTACNDDDDPINPVNPGDNGITAGYGGIYKGNVLVSVGGNTQDTLVQQVFVSVEPETGKLVFTTEGLWAGDMELGKIVLKSSSVSRSASSKQTLKFRIDQNAGFQLDSINYISVVGDGTISDETLSLAYTLKPMFAPEVTVSMPACRKIERIESDTIAIHKLTFKDDYIVSQPVIDNENRIIKMSVQDSLYKQQPCILHIDDMTLSVGAFVENPADSIILFGQTKTLKVWAPDSINYSEYTFEVSYAGVMDLGFYFWKLDSIDGYPRCNDWTNANEALAKLKPSGYNFAEYPVSGTVITVPGDTIGAVDTVGSTVTIQTIQLQTPTETYNYPGIMALGSSWKKNDADAYELGSLNLGIEFNRKEPQALHLEYSYAADRGSYTDTIFSDKVVNGVLVADTITVERPQTDTCGVTAYLCKCAASENISLKQILSGDSRIVAKADLSSSITSEVKKVDVPFEYTTPYVPGRVYKMVVVLSASKQVTRSKYENAKLFVKDLKLSYVSR